MSPSVTATSRMLSPIRATVSRDASRQPAAARAQCPIRASVASSDQWPTTVLRASRMRVSRNANSRSPCADWWVFMYSMSICAQGRARLNCVCRCSSGLARTLSPAIHICAGEKVCIQRISPAQSSAALASRQRRRIASGVVAVSRSTMRTGTASAASSAPAISRASAATAASTCSPYISWLPATNHSSQPPSALALMLEPPALRRRPPSAVRRRSGSGRAARRCRPDPGASARRASGRARRCARRPRTSRRP